LRGFPSEHHTLSRLETRSEAALDVETLDALESVRTKGQLADVYLEFANSEAAIRAYLIMEAAVRAGSLSNREVEAIKLFISQRNACDYCLSVHTMKATAAGLEKGDQLLVRQGKPIGDKRIDAIIDILQTFGAKPGPLSNEQLSQARDAGLSDENLVDMTMAASTIFFTNITNHINDTLSPLSPAPSIDG